MTGHYHGVSSDRSLSEDLNMAPSGLFVLLESYIGVASLSRLPQIVKNGNLEVFKCLNLK